MHETFPYDIWYNIVGVHLTLPPEVQEAISLSGIEVGGDIDVGVRPHQLEASLEFNFEDHGSEVGRATLVGNVEVIEPLGSETLLYVRPTYSDLSSFDQLLVARVESHFPVRRGQQVGLRFDLKQLHLFSTDEQGERVIW